MVFKKGHNIKNTGETHFKTGDKPWNYKGKVILKRHLARLNGKRVRKAVKVFCEYHNLPYIPKGYVIHHKDENSLNDKIENLELMERGRHVSFHSQLIKINLADDNSPPNKEDLIGTSQAEIQSEYEDFESDKNTKIKDKGGK